MQEVRPAAVVAAADVVFPDMVAAEFHAQGHVGHGLGKGSYRMQWRSRRYLSAFASRSKAIQAFRSGLVRTPGFEDAGLKKFSGGFVCVGMVLLRMTHSGSSGFQVGLADGKHMTGCAHWN